MEDVAGSWLQKVVFKMVPICCATVNSSASVPMLKLKLFAEANGLKSEVEV